MTDIVIREIRTAERNEFDFREQGERGEQLVVQRQRVEVDFFDGNVTDQFRAAFDDGQVDSLGSCVDRILQQFLDDACWSFNHLAGGDLVDHAGRKLFDVWHEQLTTVAQLRIVVRIQSRWVTSSSKNRSTPSNSRYKY